MLLIGTPAYGGKVHIDYTTSLLSLKESTLYNALFKEVIPFEVMFLGNESLISRGRNTIFSYFMANKKYSHLLFWDADVKMAPEGVARLLSHGKDVIGASVALKGFNADGSTRLNAYTSLKIDGDLVSVEKLGTAIFMLSRKACEALASDADTYGKEKNRGVNIGNIPNYDVFKNGVFGGEYLSEDYYACRKLIEKGFDIWVDTKIQTTHFGDYNFNNY